MTPFNVAIVKWIRLGLTFEGRATRSEYWWTRLLVFSVQVVLFTLFLAGGGAEAMVAFFEWMASENADLAELETGPLSRLSRFALVFLVVFGLLTFIPDIALSWRRFHDLGQPGWIYLILFVLSAFVSFVTIAQLIWFAFPGTKGSNSYGPDPLRDDADIFD